MQDNMHEEEARLRRARGLAGAWKEARQRMKLLERVSVRFARETAREALLAVGRGEASLPEGIMLSLRQLSSPNYVLELTSGEMLGCLRRVFGGDPRAGDVVSMRQVIERGLMRKIDFEFMCKSLGLRFRYERSRNALASTYELVGDKEVSHG